MKKFAEYFIENCWKKKYDENYAFYFYTFRKEDMLFVISLKTPYKGGKNFRLNGYAFVNDQNLDQSTRIYHTRRKLNKVRFLNKMEKFDNSIHLYGKDEEERKLLKLQRKIIFVELRRQQKNLVNIIKREHGL